MTNIFKTGEYTLTKEQLTAGYDLYSKHMTGLWVRIIQPVLFLALAVYFFYLHIIGSSNTMSDVLVLVCIAMAFVAWINPRNVRRRIIERFEEISGDKYMSEIRNTILNVRTLELAQSAEDASEKDIEEAEDKDEEGIAVSEVEINSEVTVICSDELFVIGNKRVFYVIPKNAFENPEEVEDYLKDLTGKRFVSK